MRPVTAAILLSLLTLPLYFWNLTDLGLFNTQESIRVNVAREMQRRGAETGEWLVPIRRGEPYIAKPPMVYWSQIGLARARRALGGTGEVGEFELRLNAALWGWAGVLATYFAARRLLAEASPDAGAGGGWIDPAFWSAAALAVGVLPTQSARVGEIDVMLIAPVTVAITGLHLSWRRMLGHGRAHWGWIVVATAASCVAAAVKGPSGLIVIALGGCGPALVRSALSRGPLTLGGEALSRGRWAFKQIESTHPVLVLGLPLLLLWLWLREARARLGPERFEELVNLEVQDNLRWFDFSGTARYVEAVTIALGAFLPFALIGLWRAARAWREARAVSPGVLTVLCWFGLGLLAFVISTKGVGRYLTPIWPAMAMLAGLGVATLAARERYPARLAAVLAALVLVQGTVLTWWHAFARTRAWAERSPREFVRELLPEVDRARLGTLGFNADALDFYAGQTLEAWGEGRFARPLEDLADRLKREPDPRPYTLLLMEANRRSGRDARTTAERLEAMGLAWERVPVRAVYRRPPGDARVLAWRVWARGSGPG